MFTVHVVFPKLVAWIQRFSRAFINAKFIFSRELQMSNFKNKNCLRNFGKLIANVIMYDAHFELIRIPNIQIKSYQIKSS
jgi:hypothetical protein